MDLEERTHLLQDLEIKFKEEYERFEREKEDLMIDAQRARHGEGVDGARGFDAGDARAPEDTLGRSRSAAPRGTGTAST